jgi:hypothetical protein
VDTSVTLGAKTGTGQGWRRWIERAAHQPYRTATLLSILLFMLYLPTLRVPHSYGLLVGSDGIGYFANLRSLVFDHDLNLRAEYLRLIGSVPAGADTAKYPIGVPVLWLPFYLAAHLIVLALHAVGRPIAADGYGAIYQASVCVGTMVYGYLGLLLMIRLCREFFDRASSLLAAVLLFLGWNIVYYDLFENSMSHMMSMCVVAALLVWWRCGPRSRTLLYWGGIGLCTGVAAMVRPQDAAFVVAPGLDLVLMLAGAARAGAWPEARRLLAGGVSLGLLAIVGYTPQLLASWSAYGSPFTSGYFVKGETFSWTTPHVQEVLFSRWHGLITWHPFLLCAFAGLVLLWRARPVYTLQLVIAVALQIYIVASWHEWWQGDAFGSRMLINCAPVFALGLASMITWARERIDWRILLAVAVLALLWNWLFIIQYRLDFISKSYPISWQELTIDKITMLRRVPGMLHSFIARHQRVHLR